MMSWQRKWLLGTLALLLIGSVLAGCARPHRFSGTVLSPPNQAPDFVLADHNGSPFRLSDQRGKVVMLYFGYTSCPDVCPIGMATLAATLRELGADAERVRVGFITVDPERDTEEVLRRYVTAFNPSFVGLRGTPDELAAVYAAYGVSVSKNELTGSALNYTVDHTAYTYLIDAEGRWHEVFPHGTEPGDMVADVRYFIRQGGS